jgi:hypothetical protein
VTTLLVAGLLLVPGGPLNPQPPLPTPLADNPGQLAYLGVEGNEVLLYRTRLNRDCPPDSGDCVGLTEPVAQRVVLPIDIRVSDLRIDPGGQLAALAGSAGSGTTYYVVDFASTSSSVPTLAPDASATPAASGSATPASSGVAFPGIPGGSGSPAASGSASLGGAASASPSVNPTAATPGSSVAGGASAGHGSAVPTGSIGSAVTDASAQTAASPSVRPWSSAAVVSAGSSPASSPTSSPSSADHASDTPAKATAPVIVPPPSAGMTGTSARSGPATLPPASARPILTDVWPAGMPAAWSADGSILAFSARPVDGSAGPDIYTWRPGQRLAKRLTNDHNSSFASWDGARIVGSVTVQDPDLPSRLVPRSFAIDLTTGTRRFIEATGIWLPSVDPEGEHVVYWEGDLRDRNDVPVPGTGQLIVASWSMLDPFAPADTGPSASASPSGSSPVSPSHGSASSPGSPSPVTGSFAPVATSGSGSAGTSGDPGAAVPSPVASGHPSVRGADAEGSGTVDSTPSPSVSEPTSNPTPRTAGDTAPPSPRPSPQGKAEGAASSPPARSELVPVGTAGDGRVADWLVGWSNDGRAMAVWTSAELGASVGTLVVLAVDPNQPAIPLGATIVGPISARRGFSIGLDRIAWITPSDAEGHVILQVYSWGPHGGELRSRELDQGDVLPAF